MDSRFFEGDWNNLFDWSNHKLDTHQSNDQTNIQEDSDHYIIKMAIPGMSKEDFNIHIEKDVLTIQLENKASQKQEESNFLRKEFNYSSFNNFNKS